MRGDVMALSSAADDDAAISAATSVDDDAAVGIGAKKSALPNSAPRFG
jgi:hypothetical protein